MTDFFEYKFVIIMYSYIIKKKIFKKINNMGFTSWQVSHATTKYFSQLKKMDLNKENAKRMSYRDT